MGKLLIVAWLMGFVSVGAFAMSPENVKPVCKSDVEGTYLGTLNGSQVRVNLICIAEDNISATVCPAIDDKGTFSIDLVTNLAHGAIDGNELILANFALENGERPNGSSKSIISYLTLDLNALLAGEMKGTYLSGAMSDFQNIEAKRIEKYPSIGPIAKVTLAASDAKGVFRTDMPEDKDGMNLIFNVLLGTPVISIVGVYSHFVTHFTEGLPWDNTGYFSSATAEGNGGEPDDKKLNYLRGHFLDKDHVEFFEINSTLGLRGPFHGTRIH